jgi:DNA-binding NarL/FixJ family response regulator
VLYGRTAECAAVDRLLEDARSGRSGVLVLRGEAGVGKSTLLGYAAERAADGPEGMAVLRAAGIESEVELPFATLHQLLRPLLDRVGRLPEPQAAALNGTFGLAATPSDRFLLSVGVLSLLAEAAEERPLVCLLDDAQWLDQASADALVFVARRLAAEGVVLLFAARDPEVRRFDAAGLPELQLTGLEDAAAADLLAARPGAMAAEVRDRLLRAAAGNPLALVELPAMLEPAQLAGRAPLPDPLPVGARVERAFADRIQRLPPATRAALLVVAADDTGEVATVLRAGRLLELDGLALGPAETAGLVRVAGGRAEFRHPLVRSAVYRNAGFGERRAVHLALAESMDGAADADRRAWHRAAVAAGPDEPVAAELERSAERAQARSGYAAAAAALERAAELTGDGAARAGRLAAGANAAWLAGRPDWALGLVERAAGGAAPPRLGAELAQLRGQIELFCGSPADAHRILADGAAGIAAADPERAALLLAGAAQAAWVAGDTARAVAAAEQLAGLALPEGSPTGPPGRVYMGLAAFMDGDPARAAPLLRAVVEASPADAPPDQLMSAASAAMFLGDDRAASAARAAGAVGALPWVLQLVATVEAWTGRWGPAMASASEGLRLALETRQQIASAHQHGLLAWLAAAQGREPDCRAHAAAALEVAAPRGIAPQVAMAGWALGLLDLSAGRPAPACDRLQELATPGSGHGHPLLALWSAADLVEAAVRSGRAEAAPAALALLEGWAAAAGAPWGLALAARCRGLLAGGEEAEACFAEALDLHAAGGRPFDRARTQLLYGEALRRGRRRSQARGHLRAALDGFDQLGAEPWAERARAELRASGETARRRDPSTLTQLTPQELQIARLAADGATNREIAAQLFLSPRTVEYHLYKVFPKLGIASRAELARLPPLRADQ